MVNRPLRRLRGGAGDVGCVLGHGRRKASMAKRVRLGANPRAGKHGARHRASLKPFMILPEGAGWDTDQRTFGSSLKAKSNRCVRRDKATLVPKAQLNWGIIVKGNLFDTFRQGLTRMGGPLVPGPPTSHPSPITALENASSTSSGGYRRSGWLPVSRRRRRSGSPKPPCRPSWGEGGAWCPRIRHAPP